MANLTDLFGQLPAFATNQEILDGVILDKAVSPAGIALKLSNPGAIDVSTSTLTLADDQISGDKVEGGTINAVTVNTLTSTTVNATTVDTNVAVAGVTLSGTTLSADGTDANIDINITPKGTGEVNLTKVDIDNGTIDGTDVTVGSGKTLDVSAGTLTLADDQISGDKVEGGTINAVTVNTLTSTTVNATTVDTNIVAAGVTLSGTTLSADGTDADIDINITPKGTGEVNLPKVDIDNGTIDGTDITVGSGKTLDVSAGTLTLADNQIPGIKVAGTNAGLPAFLAIPSSQQANLAGQTAVKILFGTEIFDNTNNFASSVFTAPVTGKYFFSCVLHIREVDIDGTYISLYFVTSNRNYYSYQSVKYTQDTTEHSLALSTLADMDSGDTMQVEVFCAGASHASQTDIEVTSRFSGYLVC